MWIGAVIAGVLLIIPFAVAVIGQRFLVVRAAARRSPLLAVYAGLSLACGVGVAFGSTGALRVREAEVRINGLPAALDGLRIANLADVHIGRFSSLEDLADSIEVINGRHVELLAITGDLIDDLTQLEPALDRWSESLPVPSWRFSGITTRWLMRQLWWTPIVGEPLGLTCSSTAAP